MRVLLYIIFALSLFLPVYTYVLYPLVLMLLPKKRYNEEINEAADIYLIIMKGKADKATTVESIRNAQPPAGNFRILSEEAFGIEEINSCLSKIKEGIIIFAGEGYEADKDALKELTKYFADKRTGLVCAVQERKDGKNGLFWKYENIIKKLESRIGKLSGANNALFAVRAGILENIPEDTPDIGFYAANKICEKGYAVLLSSGARVYEQCSSERGTNFKKHISDGNMICHSLKSFKRMLLFRRGCFVYLSHRVIKWFVPFDMVLMLLSSAVLGCHDIFMRTLAVIQAAAYILIFLYAVTAGKKENKQEKITAVLDILVYFAALHLAWGVGIIKYMKGSRDHKE